jgi:carbon monoxide dehydrogenase subunit G
MAQEPSKPTDNSNEYTEDKTMAQFQLSHSVAINRPAETVFQTVLDVTKQTEWRPGLDSVRDFSGEPFAVGTTWAEVSKFMGREMLVNFSVTGMEERRQANVKMEGGSVSGNMVWAVSPDTDESSTFTLSFDGEVTGWLGRLGTGMISKQADKDMSSDLENLKSMLESG